MPIFDSPDPISVNLELVQADIRLVASDRVDTLVEVRPFDPDLALDVTAAEQTRVEFTGGTLTVRSARTWTFVSRVGTIEVTLEVPTGSRVQATGAVCEFRSGGRLGECRIKAASGAISVEDTGPLTAVSANGAVSAGFVDGDLHVDAGSGDVRVRRAGGEVRIKAGNGDVSLGEAERDVRVRSSNGDVFVDRAHAGVDAKTSNGDVRIAEVIRGDVVVETASGELEVGFRDGTAAWLDLHTYSGRVRNTLTDTEGPTGTDEKARVRARTYSGDIVIRRSWL
ncbi:DUF4097 family beta strand repeat-containing protein [Saccharothrix violaceirubra]|uniref:DUF4097 and DUF4098 domain-containing protein YvlB n=1 Tax=Saccharothrix violaceirubra TaxID=413306 RepID=A0A7W7T4Y4_9PSEU|nr:DUF4097 family beta strand repeat-containing protein [Saccharothrix violaceirubra]MBB4966673.1 DUF4097 and DUF4098 domain-containing protein YvlB [Saccharothrix violaceirubra]